MKPTHSAAFAPVAVADFGPLAALGSRPDSVLAGKVFLSKPLGLTSCEISLNRVPAGQGYPFKHKHRRNEEVFIVIGGRGVFLADGREIPLREGSVVRVAPEVERTLAAAEDVPLDYICFQAPQGAMPYSFMEDGYPTSFEVPFKHTLPVPEALRRKLQER
ncbi:MAG TPA: cupin domain-containing protein [Opitutaceae bacterium]|nr:cupin domain-containing protein [Opitutaceae bacterium]